MTDNEKKQEIDRRIAAIIRRAGERINEYTLWAPKDVMYFFRRCAGTWCKIEMEYRYFKELASQTKGGDLAETAALLRRKVADIEGEILEASSFGSCTDEIVNVAHRLQIDGKREIRRKLKYLLNIALGTDKPYRVEVCDYHSDEATCKTLTLPVEYPDIESAEAAARAIIHALATFNGLEFKKKCNLYLAYYPGGHEKEGMGAYTAAVYAAAGERYEGLT